MEQRRNELSSAKRQHLADLPDVGQMLRPISTASPAGLYLRRDDVYRRVNEMRNPHDAAVPSGVWSQERQLADWSAVQMLAVEVLTHRSKDLAIANILTEALIQTSGLIGFTKGCELVLGLHEQFAATMHPAPEKRDGSNSLPLDEDDPSVESRLNILESFDERHSRAIRLLPFQLPSTLNESSIWTFAEREQARVVLGQLSKAKEDSGYRHHIEAAQAVLTRIEDALATVPEQSLYDLLSQVERALSVMQHLDSVLETVYGRDYRRFPKLRMLLEEFDRIWSSELRNRARPFGSDQMLESDTESTE